MGTTRNTDIEIEDLRNHSAEIVATLRKLLAGGAAIHPDPKREGFYEVESGALTHYIHVSPVSGKILLLATWRRAEAPAGAYQAA
ncbi:MAG: hypothetical protein LAN59_13680 [Acidobacteriia bacterium]|nr:hypothetical protein [Terriglobia bacterium]